METQTIYNEPPEASNVPEEPNIKKNNSSNTSHHLVFSLISLIVLLVAVGGVYYWQHNKVNSLNNQLTIAKASVISKSTSTTSSSTSISSNQQSYLYLYTYGVKIPLTSNIKDLYYVDQKDQSDDLLLFSTQSLQQADLACLATPQNYYFTYNNLDNSGTPTGIVGTPFGYVTVTTTAVPASQTGGLDNEPGELVAHINNYYFYYKGPQSSCSSSTTTQNLTIKQMQSFTTALKDMTAI